MDYVGEDVEDGFELLIQHFGNLLNFQRLYFEEMIIVQHSIFDLLVVKN